MTKPTAKQLAADLAIAQLALRQIAAMLGPDGLHTEANPLETNIHFNVGKARGTAQKALIESGHGTRNPKALDYVERSNANQTCDCGCGSKQQHQSYCDGF